APSRARPDGDRRHARPHAGRAVRGRPRPARRRPCRRIRAAGGRSRRFYDRAPLRCRDRAAPGSGGRRGGRSASRRPRPRPVAARPASRGGIESLAIGAWILGAGGGGSPYLALLNMRRLYADGVVVELLDPLELADDDLVAVVSSMGAPLVSQERLTDPSTIE